MNTPWIRKGEAIFVSAGTVPEEPGGNLLSSPDLRGVRTWRNLGLHHSASSQHFPCIPALPSILSTMSTNPVVVFGEARGYATPYAEATLRLLPSRPMVLPGVKLESCLAS